MLVPPVAVMVLPLTVATHLKKYIPAELLFAFSPPVAVIVPLMVRVLPFANIP